jgi:hypothetical protein
MIWKDIMFFLTQILTPLEKQQILEQVIRVGNNYYLSQSNTKNANRRSGGASK